MLDAIPDSASVYATRLVTSTSLVVRVEVDPAPEAAAPLTVTAPPVGAILSTRTVVDTSADRPVALMPVRT